METIFFISGWCIVVPYAHIRMQVPDKGAARGATQEAQSELCRTRWRQRRVPSGFVRAGGCGDVGPGWLLHPGWGPKCTHVFLASAGPKICRGNGEPLPGKLRLLHIFNLEEFGKSLGLPPLMPEALVCMW